MSNNGDTTTKFTVGQDIVLGLGSFHKTLPHNEYGEVDSNEFIKLVAACSGDGNSFAAVLKGSDDSAQCAAPLVNPQAGLAADHLVHHPASYSMPPAPTVLSETTAAEMTELYWMAILRDVPFNQFDTNESIGKAATDLNEKFGMASSDINDIGHLMPGIDAPGTKGQLASITTQNVFRIGMPGEDIGPMLSQFFVRPIAFGTQLSNGFENFPQKTQKDRRKVSS